MLQERAMRCGFVPRIVRRLGRRWRCGGAPNKPDGNRIVLLPVRVGSAITARFNSLHWSRDSGLK